MIVSNYPYWPRILKQIGKLLAVVFVLSLLSLLLDNFKHLLRPITVPDIAISVLGAVLGILLGFRTNSSYARWWEARTLWGAMINSSRSLARQAVSFTCSAVDGTSASEAGEEFSSALVREQIAFVHATRCLLRRQPPWTEIGAFLSSAELERLRPSQNVPTALLELMGEQVTRAVDRGLLNELQMTRLDATLTDLTNVLGGCERIKNTPLPRQYEYYPEVMIKTYCVLLPFVIVDQVGVLTPVITVMLAMAFLIFNQIGKNLENPFENQPYDVPMTAMSRTIEINLRQAIGDRNLPEPLTPVNGIVM